MSQQSFGGMHTEEKLQVLEKYLAAYQKVLKNTGLTTIFFDAFAGTGEIPVEPSGSLFQDVEEADPFIEGSARRALAVDPAFNRYVFVEKSKRKATHLERLRADFPHLADRIKIERADANAAIQEFCRGTNWRRNRAVLFLDPFGNQVGWSTLEVIARTKAIDVWYLFPAHLGINRQISATAGSAIAGDGTPVLFGHSEKERKPAGLDRKNSPDRKGFDNSIVVEKAAENLRQLYV